jgi:hypothetical protein
MKKKKDKREYNRTETLVPEDHVGAKYWKYETELS